MDIYSGKTAFKGITIGKINILKKDTAQVKRYKIDNVLDEKSRIDIAKEKAKIQLKDLYNKALKEVGEDNAAIFEVHQMMIDDLDYNDSIYNMIETQNVNAEYAVATTGDNFSKMFASMDDDYMKARAADINDISERIINCLKGSSQQQLNSDEPVIVVANDLAPSETVQLDKEKVLSFVTVLGSTNSHTAILARTMNIPAIIGANIPLDDSINNKYAIVDGFEGKIYIEPDMKTIDIMTKKKNEEIEKKELLQKLKGKDDITLDGKKVKVYANIGSTYDVANVLNNDAGGIGLFRSEFLYLEKDTYPTEEEQFIVYKTVAENMAGKPVIIRTCDIGADKQIDYFEMEKEDNPALGYRAIRICLDRIEMFKTQLRALLRASAFGNISIMYPMIISLDEVRQIKNIVEQIKKELDNADVKYGDFKQGIMIETPAAAMISDILAKEVDFFSIGTNDLTQYTLAIDRQNPKLDKICDTHHLAIKRLIKMVVDNAHAAGIWAGICGELAADLTLTKEFLEMGVDELSVSPLMVLPLRNKIRNIDLTNRNL